MFGERERGGEREREETVSAKKMADHKIDMRNIFIKIFIKFFCQKKDIFDQNSDISHY